MRILKYLLILMILPKLCFGALVGSRAFDDVNDFESYTNAMNVTTGNVSWGNWMRTTEDASTDAGLGKKDGISSEAGYLVYQGTADGYACEIADGVDVPLGSAGGVDKDGTWTFIICTWDSSGENLTLWQDGVNTGTQTGSGNQDSLSSTELLRIGTDGNTGNDANMRAAFAQGDRRILTETEIIEIQLKPCSINLEFCGILLGDSPEVDIGTLQLVGTVGGSTGTTTDGPPVGFGGLLPL